MVRAPRTRTRRRRPTAQQIARADAIRLAQEHAAQNDARAAREVIAKQVPPDGRPLAAIEINTVKIDDVVPPTTRPRGTRG